VNDSFHAFIERVIENQTFHAKWLNTLSLMENIGSRKIASSEDWFTVSLITLKHAAEEARHAFFLKAQAQKIDANLTKDYCRNHLLAPLESRRYLDQLDVVVCRHLKKEFNYQSSKLKYAAYLLVTYLIEVRAKSIYPTYEQHLKQKGLPLSLKMIVAEEDQHLKEMDDLLLEFFGNNKDKVLDHLSSFEEKLFTKWLSALKRSVQDEYKH